MGIKRQVAHDSSYGVKVGPKSPKLKPFKRGMNLDFFFLEIKKKAR